MCAAAALATVLGGIAFAAHGPPTDHPSMTVLVEGRVGVQIPAGWTVRRITEGPGSARVEVVSPSDPELMIHLTQSGVGDGSVADTLQAALREQPAGVFVDFDPSAVVAARQVVSYREVRAGREIRWAVFVDGVVRIAVGCQSAPGHGEAVRWACEAATRSAHAVF
jgi:type VII secretion-associated protein (TIGR03931 family)